MSIRPQLVDLFPVRSAPECEPASVEQLFAELVDAEGDVVRAALDAHGFAEFDLDYDADEKILFSYFDFAARPCFTEAVLRETQALQRMVRGLFGKRTEDDPPLRYLVFASRTPGIWNLGGDLERFAAFIRDGDRVALRHYAHACCAIGFANATGLGADLPILSVALVQGDALGAGFEAALSANIIVAERSAQFGLPEILLNLFPGMGAYTFLTRRLAPALAERIIMSGELYSAEQLHAMGAIDVLAPDGQAVPAFYDFIGEGGRRYAALRALHRARRLVKPVTWEEMTRIADLWVDAALKLDQSGLKRMLRLVAAQDRRITRRAP